jgi:hypothetical protein
VTLKACWSGLDYLVNEINVADVSGVPQHDRQRPGGRLVHMGDGGFVPELRQETNASVISQSRHAYQFHNYHYAIWRCRGYLVMRQLGQLEMRRVAS